MSSDEVDHVGSDDFGLFSVGVGHQEGELITAQAREHVGLAAARVQVF